MLFDSPIWVIALVITVLMIVAAEISARRHRPRRRTNRRLRGPRSRAVHAPVGRVHPSFRPPDGLSFGQDKRRISLRWSIVIILMVVVLTMVFDLDHPGRGLVTDRSKPLEYLKVLMAKGSE